MRTPAHAPSARLSRAAGPMPPRSSARRVLRPLPTPRKRRGEAMAERHSAIDSTGPPSRGVTVPPGRRERLGGGPFRGPITCDGYRGAPRLGRGATSAGGFGGHFGAPSPATAIEARRGLAGARRALGGLGGYFGAPSPATAIEARRGLAGARRALGGLGGHFGAPHLH